MHARQQLAQQGETLGLDLWANNGKAGDIATRPGEARDETAANRIGGGTNDDGDGGRGVLGRQHGVRANRHDDLHLEPNELLRQGDEELGSFGVASFNEQIPALHPAECAQKRGYLLGLGRSLRQTVPELADTADGCPGLRARGKRRSNHACRHSADERSPIQH